MGIWREGYRGAGEGGRRAKVNLIPDGDKTDNDDDDRYFRTKFCPREGRKLIYRDDLESWFCVQCGYTPPQPQSVFTTTTTAGNNTTTGGLTEKENLGEGGNDSNVVCHPVVGKSRTEKLADRARRLPGEDRDTEVFKEKGYTLIDSQEYLPRVGGDAAETFSSEDLRREKERKRRSQW